MLTYRSSLTELSSRYLLLNMPSQLVSQTIKLKILVSHMLLNFGLLNLHRIIISPIFEKFDSKNK